jgi:hypothetical protein
MLVFYFSHSAFSLHAATSPCGFSGAEGIGRDGWFFLNVSNAYGT